MSKCCLDLAMWSWNPGMGNSRFIKAVEIISSPPADWKIKLVTRVESEGRPHVCPEP